MRSVAFWDASVLVPLFAEQAPHSEHARKLLTEYRVCAWWGTSVEIESALSRMKRSGHLSDLDWARAQANLDHTSVNWLLVEPSEAVRKHARVLLRLYPLRAGDALQLAAALAWCEEKPQGSVFLSDDQRLAEAARLCRFTVTSGS